MKIMDVLFGLMIKVFDVIKWYFKRPVRVGEIEREIRHWYLFDCCDMLYEQNHQWHIAKLPLYVRRFCKKGKPRPINRIGFDKNDKLVIELREEL